MIEWQSRDDKTKLIIGLARLDLELPHVDLENSSNEVWDELNKLFGAKAINAKLSMKLQLFRLKIQAETTLCSHINKLKLLIA